jgi:glycosyltransferase involved in cell wall biosynthesis
MNVCIDLSAAVHHRAGIGRYSQELAAALVDLDPGSTYTAFYNRPKDAHPDPPVDRLPKICVPWGDKPWRLRTMLSHLARLPQDSLLPGVNLFHGADHLLPYLARVAGVFTLYDLTYLLTDTASTWNRLYLTLMVPRFLRSAAGVIAISESGRRDLLRRYAIDPGKVRVVYGGVDARFRPPSAAARAEIRMRYGLPANYLLTVGTIEPRKNLPRLLEAYRTLIDRGADIGLVIAGRRGWRSGEFFARLDSLGLRELVILLDSVPDAGLPALYGAADLFVFPSLYEGFGLPPLEAMACGVPVIASSSSSLPEVVGDAGVLVDPLDAGALASTIEGVLANPDLRERLKAEGAARAARFTWDAAARAIRQVYQDVLREGRPEAAP